MFTYQEENAIIMLVFIRVSHSCVFLNSGKVFSRCIPIRIFNNFEQLYLDRP